MKKHEKSMNQLHKSLQKKSTLAIIITAAVLIEVTSVVQYWYASKNIRQEVQHRAENELRIKSLEIERVMTGVEVAVDNMKWLMEQHLTQPDSVVGLLQRLMEQNMSPTGCGIGYAPDYYPEKGHWYEPYTVRHEDGSIERMQIGSEQHDYLKSDWYVNGLATDSGYWSEPYYDEAGAHTMLCTYSVALHDPQGKAVAVLGVDISLDWLSNVINASHVYPSSYNVMISRTGKLMACPAESLVMKQSIQEVTAGMKDTMTKHVNKEMMAGRSGQATVTDENGAKNYVFFAPVEGDAGWSMAVVCSDREIFYRLRQVSFNLLLLMLVGLALLAFIVTRTVKGFRKLNIVDREKERIASELHIARDIQMSMLPKMYPAYPDRDDVDMFGSLAPAKEVGGDLYDFYIRDEKLFFCIGDVSGKGVPASLVMAVTRSLFRTILVREASPDRIIIMLNESMAEMNDTSMFVTLFVGVLDLPTGRLRYSNAGHNPPLIVGRRTGLIPVDSNLPVGVIPDWKYTCQQTIMEPQTTIFLYTDGLTEAENINRDQFGEKRMKEVARQGETRPEPLVKLMTETIQQFVGDANQSDDLTMLAIQYTKQHLDVRLQRCLTLHNDIEQVPQLAEFVEEVCEELNIDPSTTMQINLALEEAVVNVMSYAYAQNTKGEINIEASANDVRLKFTICDTGSPFDPTAKEDVDTTLSVEDRPIGGLGIHLVRQLMDSINYERIDNQNVLTLRKKLPTRNA